jgi:hypothetical protein
MVMIASPKLGLLSSSARLWISDELYLVREDCVFDHANQITTEKSVARWLHSMTLRLFPDSDYALGRHRTHDSADAPTNAQATGLPSSA